MATVSKARLFRRAGILSVEDVYKIEGAVKIQLDLNNFYLFMPYLLFLHETYLTIVMIYTVYLANIKMQLNSFLGGCHGQRTYHEKASPIYKRG